VTVSSRGGEPLTVRFDEFNIHTGHTIYLEQAGQTAGADNGETEEDDQWYWIVKLDGSDEDVCSGCVAASATIERPEGAIIDIVDDVGSQGAHDAGDLTLAGQDTSSGNPDTVLVVLELPIDDYLQGLAEIPGSWPAATQEAQIIAGRSYAVAKAITRRGPGISFDVYDSVQDQVYAGFEDAYGNPVEQESRNAAIEATSGKVVVHDDQIVRTFYGSSNGGYTAASEDVFITAEPFHIAQPDPFDHAPDEDGEPQNPFPFRRFTYTVAQVSEWLRTYPHADLDVGTVQSIRIDDAPPSGRIDDALVTIIGSERTLEVRNGDGEPYGFRLYWAIRLGCMATPDCDYPRSSFLETAGFFDIQPDDYFYEPVIWMADEDITTGITPTEFGPDATADRAQVATFIWRFMDRPEPAGPSGFDDVPADVWYTDPVAWMAETGITTGTSPEEFSPDLDVTRAQLATFLWRLAGRPDAPPSDAFEDVEDGRFFTDAVAWMVHWELTTGTTPTTFSPDDPVNRGQIATFMWRLAGTPEAFDPQIELPSTMRS